MEKFVFTLSQLLQTPRRILFWCLMFATVGVLLDGTLYQIWTLKSEKKELSQKITETQKTIHTLQKQIKMANDSKFIEREARERFDLVQQDDIVFVFAD